MFAEQEKYREWLLVRGVWETLAMTFVSGFFGFVIGLPVGVLLWYFKATLSAR